MLVRYEPTSSPSTILIRTHCTRNGAEHLSSCLAELIAPRDLPLLHGNVVTDYAALLPPGFRSDVETYVEPLAILVETSDALIKSVSAEGNTVRIVVDDFEVVIETPCAQQLADVLSSYVGERVSEATAGLRVSPLIPRCSSIRVWRGVTEVAAAILERMEAQSVFKVPLWVAVGHEMLAKLEARNGLVSRAFKLAARHSSVTLTVHQGDYAYARINSWRFDARHYTILYARVNRVGGGLEGETGRLITFIDDVARVVDELLFSVV